MMPCPIPKYLLPHTAVLTTEYAEDKWGHPKTEVTTLAVIRIEPCIKFAKTDEGTDVQLSATLFFDCKNSLPSDVKFRLAGDDGCERQTVTFGGRKYVVGVIKPLYSGNRLHHYEVGLI